MRQFRLARRRTSRGHHWRRSIELTSITPGSPAAELRARHTARDGCVRGRTNFCVRSRPVLPNASFWRRTASARALVCRDAPSPAATAGLPAPVARRVQAGGLHCDACADAHIAFGARHGAAERRRRLRRCRRSGVGEVADAAQLGCAGGPVGDRPGPTRRPPKRYIPLSLSGSERAPNAPIYFAECQWPF